jgi:hypothetical protein
MFTFLNRKLEGGYTFYLTSALCSVYRTAKRGKILTKGNWLFGNIYSRVKNKPNQVLNNLEKISFPSLRLKIDLMTIIVKATNLNDSA